MIRVLVVDDHDLVRSGIVRLLADSDNIDVVGEANCGEDAVKLCRELVPDVVLMLTLIHISEPTRQAEL